MVGCVREAEGSTLLLPVCVTSYVNVPYVTVHLHPQPRQRFWVLGAVGLDSSSWTGGSSEFPYGNQIRNFTISKPELIPLLQ